LIHILLGLYLPGSRISITIRAPLRLILYAAFNRSWPWSSA